MATRSKEIVSIIDGLTKAIQPMIDAAVSTITRRFDSLEDRVKSIEQKIDSNALNTSDFEDANSTLAGDATPSYATITKRKSATPERAAPVTCGKIGTNGRRAGDGAAANGQPGTAPGKPRAPHGMRGR